MNLKDIFANTPVELGPTSKIHGLGIVSLLCGEGPFEFPDLALVEDAVSKSFVRITETSDRGEVPVLRVDNSGHQPVIILEGEELIGGKQNRVVNITVIVKAGCGLNIPVSCMEAGRWAFRRREFDSGQALFRAKSRAIQKESVMACLSTGRGFRSDQRAVWNEVNESLEATGATSASSDFRASRERMSHRIEEFVTGFTMADRQIGAVFMSSAGILGMELLATSDLFRRASDKIVRSFAFEVLSEENLKDIREGEAKSWWDKVLAAPISTHPSPGSGQVVKLDDPDLIGSGLYWNNVVVHLSCFPTRAGSHSDKQAFTQRLSATERGKRLRQQYYKN